jgi:arsenate reductase (thioredoxin)
MINTERPKRVLFICVENCNRSQMAEAFARRYGAGRVEAYSAGSRPSGQVHPKAIEAMQELGYDLTHHRSKGLADLAPMEFDVSVKMGCNDACSCIQAKVWQDWRTPCPKAMPLEQFRAVRDQIKEMVKELLASLDLAVQQSP